MKDEFVKILGKNIEQQRRKKGITRIELCKNVGMSWSTLERIEFGYVNIGIDRLLSITRFLEIDLREFIGDVEDQFKKLPPAGGLYA